MELKTKSNILKRMAEAIKAKEEETGEKVCEVVMGDGEWEAFCKEENNPSINFMVEANDSGYTAKDEATWEGIKVRREEDQYTELRKCGAKIMQDLMNEPLVKDEKPFYFGADPAHVKSGIAATGVVVGTCRPLTFEELHQGLVFDRIPKQKSLQELRAESDLREAVGMIKYYIDRMITGDSVVENCSVRLTDEWNKFVETGEL